MGKPLKEDIERRLVEQAARGASLATLVGLAATLAPSSEKRLVLDPDTGLPSIPKGRSSHPHIKAYVKAHGPVPPGHEVHHRDYNHRNNDPDNLVAIPAEEHHSLHGGYYRLMAAARRKIVG